jgi:hypothetical protein
MVSILPVSPIWDAAASFALMVLGLALLVLLLVIKEVARSRGNRWRILGQMLNVAIVPLLVTLAVAVLVRILDAG